MINQPDINKSSGRARSETSAPVSAPAGPPKSVLREYFEFILITIIQVLFLMSFIAQAVQVPTGSMQNNINIGDQLFVNKFIFGRPTPLFGKLLPAREIRRGDIVVFKLPSDPKVNYVKRVIGLPGDEVRVRGNRVFVNGQELPEQRVSVQLSGLKYPSQDYSALPELKTEAAPPGATYKVYYDDRARDGIGTELEMRNAEFAVKAPVTVPADSYFVMGDSRDNSLDSRYWGFVPRSHIIARPLYVHWSFNWNDPETRGSNNFFSKINWRRLGAAVK
jgi:signal peptidase I